MTRRACEPTNPILRTAVVIVVSAVCATACGQASGGESSGQTTSQKSAATSAPPASSTATTTDASDEDTADAVANTRVWVRGLPKSVEVALTPSAVLLMPKSHGEVLLVGLNITGPVVLQRRWACRFLYPHFRQALPIGDVKAIVFVNPRGHGVYVGSTYGGDVRPCAETKVGKAHG